MGTHTNKPLFPCGPCGVSIRPTVTLFTRVLFSSHIRNLCRTSICHSINTAIPVRQRITDYSIAIPMRYVFFLRIGADAALRVICRPRRLSRHRSRSAPKARALLDVFQTRALSTSSQRSSSSTYRDDVLTHHSYLLTWLTLHFAWCKKPSSSTHTSIW